MHYNAINRPVKTTLLEKTLLNLHLGIAEILRYEPQMLTVEGADDITATGKFAADLDSSFSLLYVYSDVVEYHIVGDIHAPLLRIVRVTANRGGRTICHLLTKIFRLLKFLWRATQVS